MSRRNTPEKNKALYEKYKYRAEVATQKMSKETREYLNDYKKTRKQELPDFVKADIMKCYKDGMNMTEIAMMFHRSKERIYEVIDEATGSKAWRERLFESRAKGQRVLKFLEKMQEAKKKQITEEWINGLSQKDIMVKYGLSHEQATMVMKDYLGDMEYAREMRRKYDKKRKTEMERYGVGGTKHTTEKTLCGECKFWKKAGWTTAGGLRIKTREGHCLISGMMTRRIDWCDFEEERRKKLEEMKQESEEEEK